MRISMMAAATISVAAAVMLSSGCSNDKSTPAASSSSSSSSKTSAAATTSAAPIGTDYSSLLIKDSDLNVPGAPTFTAAPPVLNPLSQPSVATAFTSDTKTEVIGDTIVIQPDAATAVAALQAATNTLGAAVKGGSPTPATVGDGGITVSGTSPDAAKSVTVLLFTQGKAFATIEFDGALDNPVAAEYVTMVGQKQAEAIKAGLPA